MKIHLSPIAKLKNKRSYTTIPTLCLHGLDRNYFIFSYSCKVSQASPTCPYDAFSIEVKMNVEYWRSFTDKTGSVV